MGVAETDLPSNMGAAEKSSPRKLCRWCPEETENLCQMRKILEKELMNRRQLPDVVGDRRLLRFLRGHGQSVEKASKMFAKFLAWRDEFHVDAIRDHIIYGKLKSPNDFPSGKKILKHVPQIMLSHEALDIHGNPIALEHFNFVPEVVLKEITKKEYTTFMIYNLEYKILLLEELADKREKLYLSKSYDRSIPYGIVLNCRVIRDLNGFGLGHIGLDGQTVIKWILEIAVDNYPELLLKCHMINVPWIFNSVWFFMKGLMDASTVKKVTITGTDFYKDLSKEIPEKSIPVVIGGKFVPKNILYNFDISDTGPFYCPVSDMNKEGQSCVDDVERPFNSPPLSPSPSMIDSPKRHNKTTSDGEKIRFSPGKDKMKVENDISHIDFSASPFEDDDTLDYQVQKVQKIETISEISKRMRESDAKITHKNSYAEKKMLDEVNKKDDHRLKGADGEEISQILMKTSSGHKEHNGDGKVSYRPKEKETILGSLHSVSRSRQMKAGMNHLLRNPNSAVSERLVMEGARISHILKIENMAKFKEKFVDSRSPKKNATVKQISNKTKSSSKRCTDVQMMSPEKNCRGACSIQ